MPPSSTSITDLAPGSLAHIFAFLSPEDRVRSERVSRQWAQLVRKYGWMEFRTLELNWDELKQRGDLALAKYRALLDRCAPWLRELSTAIVDYNVEQWTKMRNLRHLRFGTSLSSDTLRAVADNLKHLQSIHFYNLDSSSTKGLQYLLRINNASLQALSLPMSAYRGVSLCLPALPSSLRSLDINTSEDDCGELGHMNELLELAASCCPELVMLMLPMYFDVDEPSLLAKLARFERLFYLRLRFDPSDANVLAFGNSLAKIGVQLRALLLAKADLRILLLIAKHCPLLEHFSFDVFCYSSIHEAEWLPAALRQSVFQLAHLRSVSIGNHYYNNEILNTQIFDAIIGLNARGNIEYLHLHRELTLSAQSILILFQSNQATLVCRLQKLRMLTCSIQHNQTPVELLELNTRLQSMDRPLELELFKPCPPELKMRKGSRVRVRTCDFLESISQPMMRQFWPRALDSVPDLDQLDE